MKAQPKSRRRIIDFIADAFDEFFGGQELHRARNALMPPPPPKEQPMNLDDYIFKCPTCYDSQQVRVPALHGYKPCPDCAPKKTPEPARSLWGAPKRETPTPFDEIAPEMLAGAGKAPETPARYEMRCGHCNTTIHIGHETDPEEVFGEDLDRNVCVSCSENLDGVTVRQLQPDVRWSTCVVQDCPSPSDAAIMGRLTKLTREHWAWNGEPVRMLAATDPPTLRDITTSELETMGLRLRASQPEPPPTGKGEPVTPSLLAALRAHPDLHALITARDAFGRTKYGTGLRIDNGRDALEDAHQELGDLLQYLWQAKMEGKDITPALDQMARALSVLQGGKR